MLDKHEHKDIKHERDYEHEYEEEHGQKPDWLIKNIGDELNAAEKYYNKWTETKDALYKATAKEELKHAQNLIAKLKTMPGEADKLAEIQARFDGLLQKLQ